MERVTLIASGIYPARMLKPEFFESLAVSIVAHMKAYGLKDISVESRVLTREDAEDSQGGQS